MTTIYRLLTNIQKTSPIEPRETELLLAHLLKKPREFILTHPEYTITESIKRKIENMIWRREDGEPLAYILGHKEFFGFDFLVTADTLVPRPETEILVEEVLRKELRNNLRNSLIIDIGTGSGCITISLALQLIIHDGFQSKNSKFFGLDVSHKALKVAKINAKNHHMENIITFLHSHLLEIFLLHPSLIAEYKSVTIIANLPYVPTTYLAQKKNAFTQGLLFEPILALDGGKDGFDIYKKLIDQIQQLHNFHPTIPIHCFFEIGSDQEDISKKVIQNLFPHIQPRFINDLSGQVRVVSLSI